MKPRETTQQTASLESLVWNIWSWISEVYHYVCLKMKCSLWCIGASIVKTRNTLTRVTTSLHTCHLYSFIIHVHVMPYRYNLTFVTFIQQVFTYVQLIFKVTLICDRVRLVFNLMKVRLSTSFVQCKLKHGTNPINITENRSLSSASRLILDKWQTFSVLGLG